MFYLVAWIIRNFDKNRSQFFIFNLIEKLLGNLEGIFPFRIIYHREMNLRIFLRCDAEIVECFYKSNKCFLSKKGTSVGESLRIMIEYFKRSAAGL